MIDLSRAGAIEQPDGEGSAGGGRCDDRVRFTLRLAGETIAEVRFGADACASTTAAAAWLAAAAERRGLLDAARLGLADVLAGTAIDSPECALTAVDALHAALGDAVVRGAVLAADANRVGVAMSGGVDSAMVLTGAVEEGREAVGLTLRLWIDPAAPNPERACCAPTAVRAARDLCHARGMPHLMLDLRDEFRMTVVDPFVSGYASGETPNPCATCNGAFRFDAIDAIATRLGCSEWRTGHYARLVERDGALLVARGADPAKDQSAMLALVDPAILARVRLPLGERIKRDVVAEAETKGLAAAQAPESQEVCFLGGGDLAPFLERQGVELVPGPIVDEEGAELGTHHGAAAFTPGQRRGLGVSRGTEALHVLKIDMPANTVVVATLERLGRRTVELRDVRQHLPGERVDASFRVRAEPIPAALETRGDGTATLLLDRDAFQVAPGQVAALYDGDCIVAAGVVAG
ncbi:MAG: tRNA 2-thiouridine(34) synthase MnmA [Gaiellales bacterium]